MKKIKFQLPKHVETFFTSSTAILLMVGILIMANILGSMFFVRLDLTADQTFTLSKASRDLVGNLDDKVIAKAYFSKNLPSPYNEVRQYLVDKLADYKQYSKGKFDYQIIDPTGSTEKQQAAQTDGIQPSQVQVVKQDQASSQIAYMGVVFLYGGKQETVAQLQSTDGMEYTLTSTIKKLVQPKAITVGILQDSTATGTFATEYSEANASLQQLYTTQNVTAANIPSDLAVLIVAGVTSKLPDATLYAIDQAVMRGTKVLFMVDTSSIDMSYMTASALDSGLVPMLASYGVTINNDLVLDTQAETVSIGVGQGGYSVAVQYPYVPYVTTFGSSLVTTGLKSTSMAFASSLTVGSDLPKGLNVDKLIMTGKTSWRLSGQYNLDPFQQFATGSDRGPFALAVSLQGPLTSYFKGKTQPTATAPASATTSTTTVTTPAARVDSVATNRMIVVGSSKFVKHGTILNGDNVTFFANAIDWLAQDDGMISIRAKGGAVPHIKQVDDLTRNVIKWGLFLGLPVIVFVLAIIRFRIRQKRMQRKYHVAKSV